MPQTATYTCGSNGSLVITFNTEDKKDIAIGTGSSSSIKIGGKSLRNFGTATFGKPVWISENVYEFEIKSTSTQNGTRSRDVIYKATITLKDDNTFTYTSSMEFSKVPFEDGEVKLVISYDSELKVNGVTLAFGETDETVTYTADDAGTTITITIAEGAHAGTYTATITSSTSALTFAKTA